MNKIFICALSFFVVNDVIGMVNQPGGNGQPVHPTTPVNRGIIRYEEPPRVRARQEWRAVLSWTELFQQIVTMNHADRITRGRDLLGSHLENHVRSYRGESFVRKIGGHQEEFNIFHMFFLTESYNYLLKAVPAHLFSHPNDPQESRGIRLIAHLRGLGIDVNDLINTCSGVYGTPLHMAILTRNNAIVQFLLDHGADINFSCHDDDHAANLVTEYTPLNYAVYDHRRHPMAIYLIEHGADVNMQNSEHADNNEDAPLHLALRRPTNEWRPLLDHLAEHNIDLSIQNAHGNTPLHVAAMNQTHHAHTEIARFLQAVRARNINLHLQSRNNARQTPRQVANRFGNNTMFN